MGMWKNRRSWICVPAPAASCSAFFWNGRMPVVTGVDVSPEALEVAKKNARYSKGGEPGGFCGKRSVLGTVFL